MATKTPSQRGRLRAVASFAAALVALLIVYILVQHFFDRRWDLTATKHHSLSRTSLQVLQRLEKSGAKIKVSIFFAPNIDASIRAKRQMVLDILDEYHRRSGRAVESAKILDRQRDPNEAARLDVKADDTIALELENSSQQSSASPAYAVAPRLLLSSHDIWRFEAGKEQLVAEAALTAAIRRLVEKKSFKTYYLQGHDEASLDTQEPAGLGSFITSLAKQNFDIFPLRLLDRQQVPQDAELVIIGDPVKTYMPAEDRLLAEYIKRGGRMLIFTDFHHDPGLPQLFAEIGVELGDNLVLETTRSFQGNFAAPIPAYGDHPIVAELKSSGQNSLLSTARSVERALGNTQGIETHDLLMTSTQAWAESHYQSQKNYRYDAGSGDIEGPVTLALAIKRIFPAVNRNTPFEARAVIFGDSDLARNEMIRFGANRDLLLNSVNWLAGEEESIGIQPKEAESNFLTLTHQQIWGVFAATVVFLPGLLLAYGSRLYFQRRFA